MLSVNAALTSILRTGINSDASAPTYDFSDLVEFYASDYVPHAVNGFIPADALQSFALSEITWNGEAYRRNVITRGDIQKYKDQQTNTVSVTFSNVDKFITAWAQTVQIEGMWLVIRCISRSVDTDSIVLFVGRAGKPSTINLKVFNISAEQRPIDIHAELPLRSFTTEDPAGRHPTDPLYEGFRFVAVAGSFQFPETVPARNWFARLIGQRDTVMTTRQWSSVDGTPYGNPLPEVLGRAQMQLIPFIFADKGEYVTYFMAAANGPIAAINDVKSRTPGFSDPINSFANPPAPVEIHLGDPGGTGTNATPGGQFPTAGYFSNTAYISGASTGSRADTEDAPPTITALVKGKKVSTPDSSGVFNVTAWSDNPVALARWIFIVTGTPATFLEDSINYLTYQWCDEPLLDESNDERVFIPTAESGGTTVIRYISTGVINARWQRYNRLGDLTVPDPTLLEPLYEPIDWTAIPGSFVIRRVYRKRYTFNAPIMERVKAVDFLYKTLYPSFRGFHRINAKGKLEIHSERASDNCLLRSATIATATAVPVDDVVPWKSNELLKGKVVVGFGLTTSEARRVSSATYTTDGNAITLTTSVTGGVTSTASGATLSGGSTTVQASGTVTIGGTPASGNTVTVTINGIALTYTLDSYDTTATVALMLAAEINADGRLKRFIAATVSGSVVTIKAKYGVLNLDAALVNPHTGPRAAPTAGPTLAPSAGTMAAGAYQVAYAYVTAVGVTTIGPTSSITLTANQKIDVTSLGALPAGVTSVNWYVSESPASDKLLYYTNNNGGAFSITALPNRNNPGTPSHNTTGEECIRIALSFATNTQGAVILAQSGLTRGNMNEYNWPLGSEQSSVNQIKGNFRDAKNDFALTPFKVNDLEHQAAVHKVNPLEVDYSGVDNWHQAFRLANAALSKNREGDWYNSLTTGMGEALLLEEGDLISASDDSGGLVNVVTRIESLSISPNHEVSIRKSRKYSTLMFSDDVRQHEIPLPSVLRYVNTIGTNFIPLDIPYWRETDPINDPGFHVAVGRTASDGDWQGSRIWSDPTGSYALISGKLEKQVPIGAATTVLTATTNTTTFDNTSIVRVQLTTTGSEGEVVSLQSSTQSKVLNGANKAAIGVHGRWEIIQFITATFVSGTTWDLTGFLRGLHGTELNTSNHLNTDTFVLLTDQDGNDTGVSFIPIDANLLNRAINLKAVTVNQDVGDATAQSFTWMGLYLKPPAPVQIRGTRNTSNDLLAEWNRRSRRMLTVRDRVGLPLEEEEEIYQFEVYSGSTLVRGPVRLRGENQQKVLTNTLITSGTGTDNFTLQKMVSDGWAQMPITLNVAAGVSEGAGIIDATGTYQSADISGVLFAVYGWRAACRFTSNGANLVFRVSETNASGVYTEVYTEPLDSVLAGEVYNPRVEFRNGRIAYYKNYVNEGSTPAYISTVNVATLEGRDMRGYFIGGSVGTMKQSLKSFAYTAAMHTADGLTPGNLVKVRVYQESAIVGRGNAGEATI